MTAPLTPPGCDLRGYEYMPLYGHHLFGSRFDGSVSDFGWRTGVTLWWAAWNQVPAASLPNDDAEITKLALLGRDVKSFRKVKAEALRHFVLCDDGRLYHEKLAVWAVEAWERRLKDRARKAKWREGKEAEQNGDRDVTGTGTERGQDTGQGRSNGRDRDGTSPLKGSDVMRRDVMGSEVNKDQKQKTKSKAAAAPLPDWLPQQAWQDFVDMRNRIRKPLTAKAIELGIAELDELRKQGHDPVSLINAAVLKNWLSFYPPKENERRAGLTEAGSRTAANLERWEKSEQDKENAAD